jgi:hypothetical protein
MYREITTGIREVLDPEWDEVSRIIDFSNCWDDDKPTGDYLIFPTHHLTLPPPKSLPKPPPEFSFVFEVRKPEPKPIIEERKPKPEKPKPDRNKILWWRHEMQEIPEDALARLYGLDQAVVHEALQDEWAVIYEFWGGTPEEFRAEMRKPENIDKRRA